MTQCLVRRDYAKGGAAARLQLQSVVPVTCPTPHAQSQRGLLEWDRRRTTKDVRAEGRVTGGGRRQLLATPCRDCGLDHAHKHDVRGDDIKRDDVERGRGHTCARLSIFNAQAYTVSVCAPLKKDDVFATFFFVIAFSVNRRGFKASAVFGRII